MTPAEQTASTVPAPPPIKQCRCGAAFTHEEWNRLPYAGLQHDGESGWLELRHCPCRSTIAIEVTS